MAKYNPLVDRQREGNLRKEEYKRSLVPKSAQELTFKTGMDDAKNQQYQEPMETGHVFKTIKGYSNRYRNKTIILDHVVFIFNDKGECEVPDQGSNRTYFEILLKRYQVSATPIVEQVAEVLPEQIVEVVVTAPEVVEVIADVPAKPVEVKKAYFKKKETGVSK